MFVAPYDDPYTIAGQGTIGTEILRQVSLSSVVQCRPGRLFDGHTVPRQDDHSTTAE